MFDSHLGLGRLFAIASAASRRRRATGRERSARLALVPLETRLTPAIVLSPSLGALLSDTIKVDYDQTISASGGTGSITLSVSNVQNAIAGLNLPAGGTGSLTINGKPRATGTETFTVTATDSARDSTSINYSITVNPAITLGPTPLPADTIGVPYREAFAASGAVNTFYANQVVSYSPGTLSDPSYDNPLAALGPLDAVVGTFGGHGNGKITTYYLTPFDPAYSSSDLVEIGAGGSLVLKLAQTASTDGYTIGVHTGFGLADADYPNGTNTNPATYINSFLREADVQVSADGVNWGDLGIITFSSPSNIDAGLGTNPEGLSPGVAPAANPGQPFLGSLSSFNGLDWQQTLGVLNGSAGGTWLNLSGVETPSGTAITGVNYIKFSVPVNPPLDPNTGNPELMMIDAVVGINGDSRIAANGGTGNIKLAVSDVRHAIPGLTISKSGTNGLTISGTPRATGTETFIVTAIDAAGGKTSTEYSITVDAAPSPASTGANELNYPAYTTSVDVNLLTNVATNVGGGSGVLRQEASGDNLLIGGTATINNGSGEDIVFAGSTGYDSNEIALFVIDDWMFWRMSGVEYDTLGGT